MTEPPISKNKRNRKDKPWDTDDIDHWKIEPFTPEDNPHGLLEESSMALMFPKYREAYIKENWNVIKSILEEYQIRGNLNLVDGLMSVHTTKKTFDPYVIIKARDFIRLVARSVPIESAKRIFDDEMCCEVLKIGGMVRNKEKFIKRRQRLLGPEGQTLKALEILTDCYVLVQGQTVSVIGKWKPLKVVKRIVEDCMNNIHPAYHVKELMIKKELAENPDMKNEVWDRYLPKFKKIRTQKKNKRIPKKDRLLFPPQPTPRKEDIEMASGEYFAKKVHEEEKKHRYSKNTKKSKK